MTKLYQIKSGKYTGMWHVREYLGHSKYFHVGRYKTKAEAVKVMEGHGNG